jgi:hypothetical protein
MGRYLRFQLERWLQRGLFHQLAFMAALVLLVSILGGLAAWAFSGQFDNPLGAIWWSFLRLTDPGYLGDDEGVALRIISTVVTVLGYVLFMGSLIAILTQWLRDTLVRFEQGLSSISMRGHIVVLGWTNRTPEIVRQLLAARGRLSRFLAAHDQRRLRIVVVAEEVDAERRLRLVNFIGPVRGRGQVFLRRGSPAILGDLSRFDLGRASVIVVPGDEYRHGGAEASDAHVVKALLNLRHFFAAASVVDQPRVVAEVIDPEKESAASHAYDGPIAVIPGDAVIARILARCLFDRRLAPVLLELLTHNEGCSPFVREMPEFAGRHPLEIRTQTDQAVVIGALEGVGSHAVARLNPGREHRLGSGDQVVFIARTYDDCMATGEQALGEPRQAPGDGSADGVRRVLVLGWNAHLGQVFEDLLATGFGSLQVTLLSRVTAARRAAWFAGRELPTDRLLIEHLEADILASGTLESLELTAYDTIMIVATSHRENAEESDARVLTAYELLKAERAVQCPDPGNRPGVLLELSHPASADYGAESGDVVLTRPRLLGFLQSHVALRPGLDAVFDELFLPTRGGGIALRDGPRSGVDSYGELVRSCRQPGDIALGILLCAGTPEQEVVLCPAEDRKVNGAADLIVLAGATDPD